MSLIDSINKNTIILGLAALVSNIGGKYVALELNDTCCNILKHPIIRKIVLFCSIFLITKNIKTTLLMTVIFFVLVHGVFSEDKVKKQTKKKRKKKSYIW